MEEMRMTIKLTSLPRTPLKVTSERINQCIEQIARNLNDLRRSLVVLLELNQFGRLFIEVDRRHRIAVIGSLLENSSGGLAIDPRLAGQGTDPFHQIAIGI